MNEQKYVGPTKKMAIVKGRGTAHETRTETNITLYWSKVYRRYMSIPQ